MVNLSSFLYWYLNGIFPGICPFISECLSSFCLSLLVILFIVFFIWFIEFLIFNITCGILFSKSQFPGSISLSYFWLSRFHITNVFHLLGSFSTLYCLCLSSGHNWFPSSLHHLFCIFQMLLITFLTSKFLWSESGILSISASLSSMVE